MAKLTKLPSQKSVAPELQAILPLGFLGVVHAAYVLTMAYIANDRLQGAVLALLVVFSGLAFYKAYKVAKR